MAMSDERRGRLRRRADLDGQLLRQAVAGESEHDGGGQEKNGGSASDWHAHLDQLSIVKRS
ncbi:hypothetical protein RSW78_25895, partial [Escherichia coli]|uniref:hypothetical protein n=1 Tax=Escherichia coli TaxID=562 RepID=UPI0028DFD7C0